MTNNSSSFLLYLHLWLFKNLLAKSIVCHSLLCFCSIRAPSPLALASHLTRVCFFCIEIFVFDCMMCFVFNFVKCGTVFFVPI